MAGADKRYVDVCLVDVLRAHGYKCGYQADGPFWGMHDGNNFLEAYGPLGQQSCQERASLTGAVWSALLSVCGTREENGRPCHVEYVVYPWLRMASSS